MINKYSKRLTQKKIQDKRKAICRIINSTSKNNKTLKKNKLEETTALKYKRGVFNPNNFTNFTGEDGVGAFNDQITTYRRIDKDKISVAIVPPSKKTKTIAENRVRFFAYYLFLQLTMHIQYSLTLFIDMN